MVVDIHALLEDSTEKTVERILYKVCAILKRHQKKALDVGMSSVYDAGCTSVYVDSLIPTVWKPPREEVIPLNLYMSCHASESPVFQLCKHIMFQMTASNVLLILKHFSVPYHREKDCIRNQNEILSNVCQIPEDET